MKKSILDLFVGLGKRLDGPTFLKEFEDSSKLIGELEAIASDIKDVSGICSRGYCYGYCLY